MPSSNPPPALDAGQIRSFIDDGFVRLEHAFPAELAAACRALLWRDTGCAHDDPSTWTRPVVRLGDYPQEPFRRAANTPRLHGAFDALVGPGRWLPRGSLGTFPIRFPSAADPGDAGWHVDVSFGFDAAPGDFMAWRINVASKGRALLMLFLLSDVGKADAPTRIRIASHRDIARRLAPAGEAGLSLRELAATGFEETAQCAETTATGAAGTVYLCHPFLVHGAQPHRGVHPRFLAQPPLLPAVPLRPDGAALSPVEAAIRLAIDEAAHGGRTRI